MPKNTVCMHVHRKSESQFFRRCREEGCRSCDDDRLRPMVTIWTCLDCGRVWIPDSSGYNGQPFVLLAEGDR